MTTGEARDRLRRAWWIGVVLACGLLIAFLLNFGLPWILLKSGIGTGYEIGFLRWGTAEYHRRFGAETRTVRDVVGWAWGGAGEVLRIAYEISAEEGRVTLIVDPLMSLEAALWSRGFAAGEAGAAETGIELPESGLYQIRIARRGFHGRAKVTWWFGDRSDRARREGGPGPAETGRGPPGHRGGSR